MRMVLAFLLVFLLGAIPMQSSLAQNTLDPEELVNRIVTAPHGLTWASGPEINDLLTKIRQNSAPYIPYLLERLSVDRLDFTDLKQAEIAAMTLVEVGGTTGRNELMNRLSGLYNYSDQLQLKLTERIGTADTESALSRTTVEEVIDLRTRVDQLARIERTIVNSFANAEDLRLKDLILERLRREADVSNQLTYILYFQQTSSSTNNEVRRQLETLLNDPRSNFYDSSLLRTMIETPIY